MDTFRIDEIARRLLESVPPALRTVQRDLETNFRAVLRSNLAKLDVVTRDEFDTQMRVLQRTREKLEQLEARLRELEGNRSGSGAAGPGGSAAGSGGGATGPGGSAAGSGGGATGPGGSAAGSGGGATGPGGSAAGSGGGATGPGAADPGGGAAGGPGGGGTGSQGH